MAVQLADSQHSHIVLVAQVTITNDAAHARTLHRLTAWIAHSDGSGWAGVGGGWPAGCSASSYTVDGLRSWGPGEQVLNRRVPAHGSISLPVALATSRACAHVEPPLYVVAS